MGTVYEGVQPVIGKRVAVKVLLQALSQDQELVDRFLSEARAVNAIRHRGIVDIFSFGELENGSRYFVMEFLEGEAFDKLIRTRGAMTPWDVLTWSEEVLDALEAVHSSNIIHRDIKPSNLFLVNTGRGRPYVKLLDFGIAKLGTSLGDSTPQTRASVLIGTPDYMAPEQARGRTIGPQTDIYALGCVMYELLTGQRLFRGENSMQVMFMHVENPAPRASELVPSIPAELDDLLLWMLEKDPAKRPPTAGELRQQVEDLKRLVPNERTLALTPPPRSSAPIVATPAPGTKSGPRVIEAPATVTPAPSARRHRPSQAPRTPLPSVGETRIMEVGPPKTMITGESPNSLAPLPPETRIQPIAPAETRIQQAAVETTSPELQLPRPSRAPIFILLGLFLVGGVAAFVVMSMRPAQIVDVAPIAPPAQPKVEAPAKVDEPVKAEAPAKAEPPPKTEAKAEVPPPKTEAPPKADEPKPAPPPKAEKPPEPKKERPKSSAPSTADLTTRLQGLEARLEAKESKTGSKDRVLRQFLDQAKGDLARAKTDEQRRELSKFLVEFDKQIGP
jgi:serine/threonine-protein kinase